jgi:hypothetical protein
MVLFLALIANLLSEFSVKVLNSRVVLDEFVEIPARHVVEHALLMESSFN